MLPEKSRDQQLSNTSAAQNAPIGNKMQYCSSKSEFIQYNWSPEK